MCIKGKTLNTMSTTGTVREMFIIMRFRTGMLKIQVTGIILERIRDLKLVDKLVRDIIKKRSFSGPDCLRKLFRN